MLRASLAAFALLAIAVPATPAAAEPSTLVMVIDTTVACFGCGPSTGTLTGTVVVGEGAFRTGATVTGFFDTNEPPATCPVTGSASGTMTTSDGYTTHFTWTRVGTMLAATFSNGASATGAFTVQGNPCGAAAVSARVLLGGGGETVARGPRAKAHTTIHRFPRSAGAVGGVRLWAAPVAQNGTPWRCRDIRTGAVVVRGDLLGSPDPGVECTPPSGYTNECSRVDAGGYHADAGSGTVTVRSICDGIAVSAPIQVPSSWPGYSRSQVGRAFTPWTCMAEESLASPEDTDYWVFCDVNLT